MRKVLQILFVALLFTTSSLAGGFLCQSPVALAGAGFDVPEWIVG